MESLTSIHNYGMTVMFLARNWAHIDMYSVYMCVCVGRGVKREREMSVFFDSIL